MSKEKINIYEHKVFDDFIRISSLYGIERFTFYVFRFEEDICSVVIND